MITLADAAGPATAASPVKVEEIGGGSAISFQKFNISQVLQQGTVLVASGGQVGILPRTTLLKDKALLCLAFLGRLLLSCVFLLWLPDSGIAAFRNMKPCLRRVQGQNSSQNSRKTSSCGEWYIRFDCCCVRISYETFEYKQFRQAN